MDRPFPPGPKGPEEDVPGPKVRLSRWQLARIAEKFADAGTIEIEDRGAAWVEVRLLDAEGAVVRRQSFPQQ